MRLADHPLLVRRQRARASRKGQLGHPPWPARAEDKQCERCLHAGVGARRRAEPDGFTLGFHIILASFGVAFPAMMLIAN